MGIEIKVVDGDPEHDEETLLILEGLGRVKAKFDLWENQSNQFKCGCNRTQFVMKNWKPKSSH